MSSNLNVPWKENWVVVPFKIGEYASPLYDPEMLIIAEDEISDLTIWPNWSIKAM